MTKLTLPRKLTGAACYPEDPQVRRFDPTLPPVLRAWCRRRGACCEGHRLLLVVLTGFRLPDNDLGGGAAGGAWRGAGGAVRH
jgi:hypothetical protein